MRRRGAHTLTALACGLALAGCSWSYTSSNSGGIGAGAGGVGVGRAGGPDALVQTLNSFTDELLSKIEKAQDKKAGVAEAQSLLDARKGDLAARLAALKRDAQDAGAKAKLDRKSVV